MHFDAITYSLLKDRKLRNVAPLCTIETDGWTGSTSGEVLFTGDGTTKDFSGKVDLPPVNPLNSFTLHYTIGATSYSVTADENGNLSDANMTGTINQDGTYEFHFNTPPDNGTDGTADYNYGIAPTNIERALDPVNPQLSDWGWKTLTGSGTVGNITIYLPEWGHYIVNLRHSFLAVSGTPKIDLIYWSYDETRNTWHWTSLIASESTNSSEKDESNGFSFVGDRFLLNITVDSAGEIKWRLRSGSILKLF